MLHPNIDRREMADSYKMDPEKWSRQLSRAECPFCRPREDDNSFCSKIATLGCSTLYLSKDQRFEWRSLLIFDARHAVGLDSLSENEHADFCRDLRAASQALKSATGCELANAASLGNQIAHLHFHLIPRSPQDPRWAAPLWTTSPDEIQARTLAESELLALLQRIASLIAF